MGCNGSKNRDIQESRTRVESTNTSTQARPAGAQGASSQPIANRHDAVLPDDQMGRSPHDMRFAEREFFSHVVEQTASSLIDISQTPEFLSAEDARMREADYASLLATVQPAPALQALLALPAESNANADPAAVLQETTVAPALAELGAEAVDAVAAAVAGMAVEPMGDIVMALPDIQVNA
ncbi:uncharacterized protein AMSG_02105 [Thecamonas trahens ATCC 50062]|uniref:Uncharacterized protein n=1 Tax=Thecamonas trahens ATCC 50062 TaxID=461836 RepID=A0A0L0DVB3_THETB|nr:hypothetical protein AMSG_02105 [Thecamonas trahens ATCC 50062]KNC56092.1 hypothetical protein AMSG_02105 [Thecamonas trahens ATCC 50062]|eukprot:XP_013761134.1 hypothetical protein AMSG_02105 [Thecamonas trahens ATCC 50062]